MLFKQGNKIIVGEDLEIIKKISKANWLIVADESQTNFTLEKQEDFTIPETIYGDETEIFERFLDSFNSSDDSLGVLLSGSKGSGKSLTAKRTCVESKLPILLVTEPLVGENFIAFLSQISQEVVVFIDEFEKIYSSHELQASFLSILDGVFQNKKLFVFTSNSKELNPYLMGRPGRVKYHIKYNSVAEDTKEEIINDLLVNKKHKQGLLDILEILGKTSVDVVLNLIKEMNLYGEEAPDVIKFLNIRIEETDFNVRMYIDGVMYNTQIHYNPLSAETIYLSYNDGNDHRRWYSKEREFMTIEVDGDEFEFRDTDGNKFVFSRFTPYEFNI